MPVFQRGEISQSTTITNKRIQVAGLVHAYTAHVQMLFQVHTVADKNSYAYIANTYLPTLRDWLELDETVPLKEVLQLAMAYLADEYEKSVKDIPEIKPIEY